VTLCVHRRAPTVRGPCNGECVVDIPLRAKVSRAAIDVLLLSASLPLSLSIYIYIYQIASSPYACKVVGLLVRLSRLLVGLSVSCFIYLSSILTYRLSSCPDLSLPLPRFALP